MPSTAPQPRDPSQDPTRARYETLLEVAESIAAHRQLSTLFADLSRLLKPLVPFDFISLSLLDNKERVVRLHTLETDQPILGEPPKSTPFDQTPTIVALRTRRPYYIPDIDLENRFPLIRDLLRANGVLSACILPLVSAQRELGGLHFGSMSRNGYTAEDIEFMGQVARQVAVAVDNALNSEAAAVYEAELARERDRLRTLLEVNNAVVGCLETRELFKAIAASLRRSFGLDYASMLLFDAEAQALRLHMLDFPGGSGAIREDAIVSLDDSLAGFVFRSRQGRVFSLDEARRISPSTGAIFEREGIQSLCCVPLLSRGNALGTLNAGAREPGRFGGDDLGFITQVAGQVAIALDNALSYERIEELNARLEEEKIYLEDEIRTDNRFEEIVGQSRSLKATLKQLETVAPTDSTVLIYGETGTGKELLARAIHDLSARKQGTFVKLNCAAIPTGLLESELFGHEKGAFTGAIAQRIGRFELANRGTIFLDEVGEIPIELQSKLLRVLQEREFERLGSSRTVRTDARLVAATNRDLAQLVEQREFRADLYYRLNVFPMTAPPLRERRDDIPLLVRYFVQQYARRMNRRITSIPTEAMNTLARYHWPGNIRELQNFIERAVILSTGSTLHVPLRELRHSPGGAAVVTLETAERDAIQRALRESGGKVGGTAGSGRALGHEAHHPAG